MSTPLKPALVICLVLAAVQPVSADDDCEIGIYFDEDATIRAVDADPGTVVHAYLALSLPAGQVYLTDLMQMPVETWNVPDSWVEVRGGGVNNHVPYGGGDLSLEITWDTPYPVDGVTVVADFYIPIEDTDPIPIFTACHTIAHGEGDPVVLIWNHCTYCDIMPPQTTIAATINSDYVPVRSERGAWSDVKAMYR